MLRPSIFGLISPILLPAGEDMLSLQAGRNLNGLLIINGNHPKLL